MILFASCLLSFLINTDMSFIEGQRIIFLDSEFFLVQHEPGKVHCFHLLGQQQFEQVAEINIANPVVNAVKTGECTFILDSKSIVYRHFKSKLNQLALDDWSGDSFLLSAGSNGLDIIVGNFNPQTSKSKFALVSFSGAAPRLDWSIQTSGYVVFSDTDSFVVRHNRQLTSYSIRTGEKLASRLFPDGRVLQHGKQIVFFSAGKAVVLAVPSFEIVRDFSVSGNVVWNDSKRIVVRTTTGDTNLLDWHGKLIGRLKVNPNEFRGMVDGKIKLLVDGVFYLRSTNDGRSERLGAYDHVLTIGGKLFGFKKSSLEKGNNERLTFLKKLVKTRGPEAKSEQKKGGAAH